MVTIRKRAACRYPAGRVKKSDYPSVGDCDKASFVHLKLSRRTDQRSAFSIAGSARSSSTRSSAGRQRGGCETAADADAPAARRPRGSRRQPGTYSIGRTALRANTGTSNSAGILESSQGGETGTAGSATYAVNSTQRLQSAGKRGSARRQGGGTRKSLGSNRQGKTVSISASQEVRSGGSSYLCFNSHSDFSAKRSIIKLRPLPKDLHNSMQDVHNEMSVASAPQNAKTTESGMTLHQQREQKIFGECRFIPSDTFYKKVIVAPSQVRRFFAAPRCTRVPGPRVLYDIAADNRGHHRDVNLDFTRDGLRKVCSNYCKPHQFRHIW